MRPKGKRHNTIPIQFGGQFSAGDPTTQPDGTVRLLRNYMIRANRWDGRAPFVYDGLRNDGVEATYGFVVWQDLVNEVTKTLAVAVNSGNLRVYPKSTSGSGYGAAIVTTGGNGRPTSYTNILGKLYMMLDNFSGVPAVAASFDGTNLSITPFNTPIVARTVNAFVDRLFLTDPRVTVTPVNLIAECYGSAIANKSNVNVVTLVSGSTTKLTACPTSSSALYGWSYKIGFWSIAANTADQLYMVRHDFRNNDRLNALPLTLQVYILPDGNFKELTAAGARSLAVTVGQLGATAGAGTGTTDAVYLWRCTTAGTTAVGAPTFNTTKLGGTVTDGTAVWTAEAPYTIAMSEQTIPPSPGASGQWIPVYFPMVVPWRTNSVSVYAWVLGGTTASPTLATPLNTFDIAFKDGLADGDPRKQNYGFQITSGDYYYPFVNTESATSSTQNIDSVIWSEINNPASIQAKNFYPLTEIAGLSTAATVTSGKYVVFKRRGMWIFIGNADANEPILPQTPAIRVGCLGPQALDVSRDDTLYWIGEQHVYKMNVATEAQPTEIDSPGMFEEIMARGSGWVESQSAANLPILRIDHANKDVWIYTQAGKIYIYSIQAPAWSYIDANPTGTSPEVLALVFDPVSNRMLASFLSQSVTRFDETSDAQDNIVAGGMTFWDIANDIVPKPLELFSPRYEASILELGLFHNASILNGSLTPSYSFDRGVTYTTPSGYPVTSWSLTNPRIRLPLAATNESVIIKLSRTGAGGARNWSISKADALIRVHRGELPKNNAT